MTDTPEEQAVREEAMMMASDIFKEVADLCCEVVAKRLMQQFDVKIGSISYSDFGIQIEFLPTGEPKQDMSVWEEALKDTSFE